MLLTQKRELHQVVSEAALTAEGFLPEDGSGVVVGLQDLAELESACLATAGGDVVLFNFNTGQVSSTKTMKEFKQSLGQYVNERVILSWSVSAVWTVV